MYRGSVDAESTNCNAYLSNIDGMSLSDLVRELESLASAWRRTPRRAFEFHDRVLCNGLTTAISARYGLDYYILANGDLSQDFQVYTPPRTQ